MAIAAFDHANIRTGRIAETVAFYTEGLGMTARPAPGRASVTEGAWILDEQGRTVLHLGTEATRYPDDPAEGVLSLEEGSGAVHHIALRCDDPVGVETRLRARGAEPIVVDRPEHGIRQIFARDPNGLTIELNCPLPA